MTESPALSARWAPPADFLRDRVVLVTGAGRGLGRAVALACAAHGATVALLGRRPEALTETYDAIVAAGGKEPAAIPLDLATAGDREFDTLAQMLRRDLGQLDALVHCAVHFTPLGPLRDQPLEHWMAHLRVNLAAPFALTRACLPLLGAASDGAVVFTVRDPRRAARCLLGGIRGVEVRARMRSPPSGPTNASRTASRASMSWCPVPWRHRSACRAIPGESRATLPQAETVANAYLRLLSAEGRAMGSAPLAVVT